MFRCLGGVSKLERWGEEEYERLRVATYQLKPGHRNSAQDRFKETGGGLPPEGVEMVGRWHCAQGLKGIVIAETTDAVAIGKWLQEWTDLLTFEVTPVLYDRKLQNIVLGGR